MRRRKLLAGVASASTITALAGCLSDDDGETDDPDGDDGDDNESNGDGNESNGDGNESDGGDDQTGVDSPDIETVAQRELDAPADDERNVESTATVSSDAETIEIEGSLEAATPCHEAVIADTSIEDGTLTVRVELEDTDDGEACTQQISEIEYEASIVVEEGDPTHVVVVHTDRMGEVTAADVDL